MPALWVDSSGPVFVAGNDGGGNGYLLLGPKVPRSTADSEWTWPSIDVDRAPTLRAVWGTSPDDVWACGDNGALRHGSRAGLHSVATGTDQELHGVWGSGPNDVYVVGWGRTLLHYQQ